jgi:hypothetical protein
MPLLAFVLCPSRQDVFGTAPFHSLLCRGLLDSGELGTLSLRLLDPRPCMDAFSMWLGGSSEIESYAQFYISILTESYLAIRITKKLVFGRG